MIQTTSANAVTKAVSDADTLVDGKLSGGMEANNMFVVKYGNRSIASVKLNNILSSATIDSDKNLVLTWAVKEGQETYKPQDLFHLDVSEISPSFTMGLVCRNLGEFITMLKRLENIPKNKQIKHAFDFKINRLNQFSQQNMGAFQSMNN